MVAADWEYYKACLLTLGISAGADLLIHSVGFAPCQLR